MKITVKAVVIAVIVGGVLSFGFGFVNGMIRERGGQPMSEAVRLGASVGFAAATLFIVSAFSGTKKLALAGGAEDRRAKSFAPAPGRGVVYLFRDAFVGKLVGIDVLVDGRAVAQTRGKTFVRLELEPGQHVLTSSSPAQGTRSDLPLEVAAGSLAYVEQSIKMGAMTSAPQMAVVAEADGQKRVRRCRLVAAA